MTSTKSTWFSAAMYWRMLYGSLRILLGLAILKIIGQPLIDIVTSLMSQELIEDPHDLLYQTLSHLLNVHPAHFTYFMAGYLLFWGLIDTVLSYNLLKDRLWAFPVSLVLIGLFVVYEIIRATNNFSLALITVICIDAVIWLLTWREYRRLRTIES